MNYYIGIDIGGTKIAGAIITAKGKIVIRSKTETPKAVKARDIEKCVHLLIDELIKSSGYLRRELKGIGMGIPGIVDTHNSAILAAPNINLTGYPLSRNMKAKYRVPIAMANDVNCGLLGEMWQGCARGMKNVVGIFPGTGVGGAVISNGKLLLGIQGAATELGHMIININGPLCHCGNHGCLEALTSRWAIERDIRALIKSGRRSMITKLNKGKVDTIKSRVLKEALEKKDAVTLKVISDVSHVLGKASISLNHIFNPQAIVFGGGVIKACGFFMLPIMTRVLKADPFFKKFNKCSMIQSTLGDDAVVLGAAHLVM